MSAVRAQALERLESVLPTIGLHAVQVDKTGAFPEHTTKALSSVGLMGLVTPSAHGGMGGTATDAAVLVERIARHCGSSAMVMSMHWSGAAVLAAHGSAQVNQDVAAGKHLSTLAFSEAGSRSHFWAPLSTATADGNDVVLDASKSWCTSARRATAYVWSSRPMAAEGFSSVWLVERERAGLSVPTPFDGLGLRGNDSAPIVAKGVRIPKTNALGPDGGGFDLMMGVVLPVFQAMNAACSVGLSEAAITGASAHLRSTSLAHMNQNLSDLPTVRAYLAKAKVKADMARTLWEDTLAAIDAGRPDTMLRVLEVKAAAGETALEVVATCMRVCGGAAYRKEVGVERAFRDAQASSVMGPTSDVLYDFIGKAALGMPLFG
jgi:alkylation response protein AidB-like acyl-CoA dehydrogenase